MNNGYVIGNTRRMIEKIIFNTLDFNTVIDNVAQTTACSTAEFMATLVEIARLPSSCFMELAESDDVDYHSEELDSFLNKFALKEVC